MLKKLLVVGVAIATSLTFAAEQADAFGGRGYARRQVRRAYYPPVPVVAVPRVYAAPVVPVYHPPVYRPPVYHPPAVSIGVGRYGSYYGPGYFRPAYPAYGGVSVRIGW